MAVQYQIARAELPDADEFGLIEVHYSHWPRIISSRAS